MIDLTPGRLAFNVVQGVQPDSGDFDLLSEEVQNRWENAAYDSSKLVNDLHSLNERALARAKIRADNPPEIDEVFGARAYFAWSWKGCGFGQLSFSKAAGGEITCMNECMSRDMVRTILHAFADHVADTFVLEV